MTAREVLLFLRQTAHFVVALGLAKLEERITVMLLKRFHVGAHVCCPGKEDGPTRLLLQLVDVLQKWICGRARDILAAFYLGEPHHCATNGFGETLFRVHIQ